jgi:hypothetical protein
MSSPSSEDAIAESALLPHLGKDSIFPKARHPFYIVTPPYVRSSAGIKALHLLCHHLNLLEQPAFIVAHPNFAPEETLSNPDWNTPLLTQALVRHHHAQGLTPIALYPETICGNPLRAPVVMRYVLNYPGLLGGDVSYDASEIVYGYSSRLAEAAGAPGRVLFIPVSDGSVFHPPGPDAPPRRGTCFWAAKYRYFHNGELFPVTRDSLEITRDLPDSPDPRQIADLLRRSEVFYAYENTALAIEAVLCGCPAVFLPNPHFTESIGQEELGWDGFAWGDDEAEIARARSTVAQGRERYLKLNDLFWKQLRAMANECQRRAQSVAYAQPIRFPLENTPEQLLRSCKGALRYWRQHGTKAMARKIGGLIRRKGVGAFFQRAGRFFRFLFSRVS